MTISRKSMESSWSLLRRRISGLMVLKSSSGAMSEMISITSFLQLSFVMEWRWCLGSETLDDQGRVNAQHTKRIIEDRANPFCGLGLVDDQARDIALRIKVIDVDGRVNHEVVEARQIACQFEGSGRSHGVSDKAFRVVDMW